MNHLQLSLHDLLFPNHTQGESFSFQSLRGPCTLILNRDKQKKWEHLKKNAGDSLKVAVEGFGVGHFIFQKATHEQNSERLLLHGNLSELKAHPTKEIHLIVAVARPPTIKKVIEYGTSLGATKFTFVRSNLSDKTYEQSHIWRGSELTELAILGLEQSAYFYTTPEIKTIFENQALEKINNLKESIVLHPDGLSPTSFLPGPNPLTLLFGPERGWSPAEIQFFNQHNLSRMTLTPSILRLEVAVISALTLFNEKGAPR